MPIEKFISNIVPGAKSIEVFFENNHSRNLVSLIAPCDLTAKGIFKWDNPFSWSYNGDVADSIKERVKKAGGNIDGDVCCRLSWNNRDDLDLHMNEASGKFNIFYPNRRRLSPNGGMLDIDANGGDGLVEFPCENIFYKDKKKMRPGTYLLRVNQFRRRENVNYGFEVEIEIEGETFYYSYPKIMKSGEFIEIARIIVDNNYNIKIESILESRSVSKNIWNINTNQFHKVSMLMLSPNFWNGCGIGNKHYFFILDGCVNNDSARGFYNEFLLNELEPHRKTMEMLGCMVRTEKTENQLSGLGFSSTQRSSILCKVSGSFNRIIKVVF